MGTASKSFLVCVLATTLSLGIGISSFAQTQNAVGGGANGASVNVSASVLGIPANVQVPSVAPVSLPPEGGSFVNQVASVSIGITPGILPVLSTALVINTTNGSVGQSSAHAESSSTVNSLNVLNGLVTATTVRSKSTSDGNGTTASSSSAGTFANQLRIAGVLYQQSEFAPNTEVDVTANIIATINGLPVLVPVSGTVIINEQVAGGNGQTTSSLTVNFLHVNVSGSVAGLITLNANIIVASATSSVNFTGSGGGNNPPTLTVPGSQTVQAGSTLNFNVSGSDPNAGDIVTLSASNVPANASFNQTSGNPANGQFSFTPSQSQVGSFTVNFSATDNHGASVSSSVVITVTSGPPPPNSTPTLNVPGPQTVQVGSTLNFGVSGSDPNAGDIVTLSASNVPANATFNQTSGNPANGQFSFSPVQSQAGQTFTVNFTATDNHGASVSGSVAITVTAGAPSNSPPNLTVPGPQSIQVGSTLNFSITGTDPDAGDIVTLSATNVPANASFNQTSGNPANGQFSFTPSQSQSGQTFTVNFTATDNHGASLSKSVAITVTAAPPPANHPPSLVLPGAQSVQVGATLSFGASASDPDAGDIVTLSASNLPTGATVTPNPASGNPATSQFSFTPSQNQVGQTFVVNYTATDSHGASTPGSVSITVLAGANHPPIISVPGPQVIGVGQLLTFTVTASDPDGDAVTLTGNSIPVNATFIPGTGLFSFNPTSSQAGQVFSVTFTATDSRGASSNGTVQITVTTSAGDGNPPPIISVPPSPMIVPVGQLLTFTVVGSSPVPGCTVRLSASGTPDHSQFDGNTGRFDFTPGLEQENKSFVVTFTVTDCIGLTANATVTIIVVSPVGGVVGPGRICVPVNKIFFGATPVNGGCGYIIISLTNEGVGNLTISSLKLDEGRNFTIDGIRNMPMPLVLKSASVLELKILFQPKDTGAVFDNITIHTSDPDNPTLTIALKGKGAKQ